MFETLFNRFPWLSDATKSAYWCVVGCLCLGWLADVYRHGLDDQGNILAAALLAAVTTAKGISKGQDVKLAAQGSPTPPVTPS